MTCLHKRKDQCFGCDYILAKDEGLLCDKCGAHICPECEMCKCNVPKLYHFLPAIGVLCIIVFGVMFR